MERLWAPWRMRYIEAAQPREPGCIFCHAAAAAADDESYVVLRGQACFTILNAFPYNNGHLMVVPYEHVATLAAVSAPAQAEMLHTAGRWCEALTAAVNADGFNLGMNLGAAAGAGIADHVHLHLVPRWNGDTNFMPVVGETKVLPEDLAATRERLRAAWRRQFGDEG